MKNNHLRAGWWRALNGVLAFALALTSLPLPQSWAAASSPSIPLPSTPATTPLNLATLNLATVSLPEDMGDIQDAWQPSGATPHGFVIHIQDLHTQPDAQRRLSTLIGYLKEQFGISLVAVEGAEGLCDTTPYSDFPDPAINERIARLFLEEGLFTGSEYYAITHPGAVTLWGVDDQPLYLAHLNAYKEGTASSAEALTTLTRLQETLKSLQAQLTPRELKRLQALREADTQHTNKDSFSNYFKELLRLAKSAKLSLTTYPHLQAYEQALALYDRLDMRLVEADRDALVQTLASRLTLKERHALAQATEALKTQHLAESGYYAALAHLAAAHGIPLPPDATSQPASFKNILLALTGAASVHQAEYLSLRRFLTYLQLTRQGRSARWQNELEALETAIEQRYFTTERQRTVTKLLRQLALLEDLFQVRMTPGQYQRYTAQGGYSLLRRCGKHSMKPRITTFLSQEIFLIPYSPACLPMSASIRWPYSVMKPWCAIRLSSSIKSMILLPFLLLEVSTRQGSHNSSNSTRSPT